MLLQENTALKAKVAKLELENLNLSRCLSEKNARNIELEDQVDLLKREQPLELVAGKCVFLLFSTFYLVPALILSL